MARAERLGGRLTANASRVRPQAREDLLPSGFYFVLRPARKASAPTTAVIKAAIPESAPRVSPRYDGGGGCAVFTLALVTYFSEKKAPVGSQRICTLNEPLYA